MTDKIKIRLALADSLEAEAEASLHVINCVRMLERQYDDLFALAVEVTDTECPDAVNRMAEFLAAQVRRFPQEG